MARRETQTWLLRLGVAAAAAATIVLIVKYWLISGNESLTIHWGERRIDLLQPRWLYLVSLAPYFFLVRAASLTDLSLLQQLSGCLSRSVVVVGLSVALARPATPAQTTKVATVVLVDVSRSISDKQLGRSQEYIDAAWRARKDDDQLFVISFAERPRVIPAGPNGEPPRIGRGREGGLGTDVQAALELAYGLFPPGTLPRVVVLSDGNQTSGDLVTEAYKAKEFGIRLSWQTFEGDEERELRVVALHLPDEIKVGAPFEVVGEIWSTHAQELTLHLRQDDFPNGLEPSKRVALHEGKNRVRFRSEAKTGGFVTYRLSASEPPHDTEKANNETVASAHVRGKPHILYVEGGLDRDSGVASYLKRALERENMAVEVRGVRGVPASAKELERFDLVLVSDVPEPFLGPEKAAALEAYVRNGGGFVMAGGEDSFGSGGYQGTRIEKILPVRFDGEKERQQPSLAVALVIDRSGSMSTGAKLEMAKEAARATAEVLDASDLIGVIAFDNQPTTVVRLQRASNRLRISSDIARLLPGGGTNILPALQEAYGMLASANAKVKHVILLSDGQAAVEGIAELCDELRSNRITVSAVGIGDADRNLLQMVAEHGDGRFYMTENASELPKIFMKETHEIQKSSLVEDAVTFHVVKRVEMIEGTGVESAPLLDGYVSTKAKPMAEVIGVSDRGEPLLARWRLGAGQVVAWTSDVKNRWAARWLAWPGYQKFWVQVVRATMRERNREATGYDLFARVDAGIGRVVVDAVNDDDRFVNDLDTELQIIDPRDSKVKRTLPMEQTAAGRYEAQFPVDRYGTYMLKALHSRGGRVVAESTGSMAMPYPAEYLRSSPNEAVLQQATVVTGGRDRPPPEQIFDAFGETLRSHKDLWPYVLLAASCLFVLDVFLRRVRLFGYRAVRF